ncbi:carbohydrate-binding domain-containing protein [Alkalihalobacillus sp. MEB130]|uniref:carbohydrate-binding domain-containing protein n=1 Tax=Alkalihalobacillus sp. MEB130 TaxID=2976704 RepID=UPI0028DFB888|nr:carbohydrate-binding domain-containing protein [Alkalihalobacillus sp. MEB130]MDT8862077.1 carbohydrate-binding domain-containing protein [Alkalihalobacillus sp. MEB130]
MNRSDSYSIQWAATLLCVGLLFGCSDNASTNNEVPETAETVVSEELNSDIAELVAYAADDYYTDWESEDPTYIEFNGSEVSYDSASIINQDGVVTIKTGGTYVLTGKMDDGQIVVDAEDKSTVRLVLNGVELHSSTSSAIHVVKAEKTTISLPEGTENIVSDASQYIYADSSTDEPNAAIFSKADLTINGTGTLVVEANYNNGISSKDQLKITGGNLDITAVDDGLMGRDLVAVQAGTFTIKADGDGVKSTHDKDSSKGSIVLEGGTFTITSGNDGIQAQTSLYIADGSYNIVSGGGSPESISNYESKMQAPGGTTSTSSESSSTKALKAATDVSIGGGSFNLDSLDDSIHSNGNITITGGQFTIASGDDAIHADSEIVIEAGTIDISKSYEGLEGQAVTINGGDIQLVSSDDGINVSGGNDGSSLDMKTASTAGLLSINGGTVFVNANGDGLDANGSIEMTGGTVYVNGPTSNGEGALDYDARFDLTGGTLIAAGSAGMNQAVSDSSSQHAVMMTFTNVQPANTTVELTDSTGTSILQFAPEKEFQTILMSSPDLAKDTSYTLSSSAATVDVTISDVVTWLNEEGVTTAGSIGGMGGMGRGGFSPDNAGGLPPGSEQARPDRGAMFADLDEETRAKVEAIMQQMRDGTITREVAEAQLAELGVETFGRGERP